jgi:hypothetical protein
LSPAAFEIVFAQFFKKPSKISVELSGDTARFSSSIYSTAVDSSSFSMARIGETINTIPKNRNTMNKKLLDLAIAIFLDNLVLKIYFDGEAYTPHGIYTYMA